MPLRFLHMFGAGDGAGPAPRTRLGRLDLLLETNLCRGWKMRSC
jgi:hypothetical protein